MGLFERFYKIDTWFVLLILILIIGFKISMIIKNTIKKHRDIVMSKSIVIEYVKSLNNRMVFINLDDFVLKKEFNTLDEFQSFDFNKYLYDFGKDNINLMFTLYGIQKNKQTYIQYEKEYNDILNKFTQKEKDLYAQYKYFEKIEKQILEEIKIVPMHTVKFIFIKSYLEKQIVLNMQYEEINKALELRD